MPLRIGINGFGRMGHLGLRAAFGWDDLEFVHINEIACDAAGSAHLPEFDSIHGRYDRRCESSGENLAVDGQPSHTRETSPSRAPTGQATIWSWKLPASIARRNNWTSTSDRG